MTSFLVRVGENEAHRYDLKADRADGFQPDGLVACRWTHAFKPRGKDDNPERTLKLGAENLFLALADPSVEPTPENTRLLQFLALMLERKRVLRPRGLTADGARRIYEHTASKQAYEIAAGDFGPEFFNSVQAQLSVLVGEPKKAEPAQPAAP